jgi:hypothetical protein
MTTDQSTVAKEGLLGKQPDWHKKGQLLQKQAPPFKKFLVKKVQFHGTQHRG